MCQPSLAASRAEGARPDPWEWLRAPGVFKDVLSVNLLDSNHVAGALLEAGAKQSLLLLTTHTTHSLVKALLFSNCSKVLRIQFVKFAVNSKVSILTPTLTAKTHSKGKRPGLDSTLLEPRKVALLLLLLAFWVHLWGESPLRSFWNEVVCMLICVC